MKLIGWVDAWTSPYTQTVLTEERRALLIECIRRRHYNFTHQTHQTLPYSAPFYDDKKLCVLTKAEWDEVLAAAYIEIPLGARLTPSDAIHRLPKNDILYENEKDEKGDDNNG